VGGGAERARMTNGGAKTSIGKPPLVLWVPRMLLRGERRMDDKWVRSVICRGASALEVGEEGEGARVRLNGKERNMRHPHLVVVCSSTPYRTLL